MSRITAQSVRQYYDQNTRLFTLFGGSNRAQSIHRALWLPGVAKLDQALAASNELVWQEIHELLHHDQSPPLRLADLGCGIGGTLFALLKKIPIRTYAIGITISPAQARTADNLAQKENHRQDCRFVISDFQAAPLPAKAIDLAYSIEAFVHAPYPTHYLAETARLLRPGGRLVLIDDFLSDEIHPKTGPHSLWLDAYQHGWRIPGLRSPAWVAAEAASLGLVLVRDQNLTACLRLRTVPNWAVNPLLKFGSNLPQRHAIWGSMVGSLALQHCLKGGLVEYHLLVFERRA